MVDAADTPVLAVLTRAPSSRGKTRLFASLGVPPDPGLLTALLLDTLDGAAVPGVRRVVAVTPASACDEVRAIAGDVEVMAQPDGDLGERMRATMAALFARGASVVVLIGSDLPQITAARIADACALVAKDPDALGARPGSRRRLLSDRGATGARRLHGNHVGKRSTCWRQTERAAAAGRFHVYHLPMLADVDTADDLHGAARSGRAPRVAAWLEACAARLGPAY